MILLNKKEATILKLLSRYKFLTVSQLAELGLSKKGQSNNYLSSVLRSMRIRRKPRIACIEFKGTYKFDKREYVYYLTKFGEELLINEFDYLLEKIKRPLSSNVFYDRDYTHRKLFIDSQIEIYKKAKSSNKTIGFFDCYFDSIQINGKKKLESKTKVRFGEDRTDFVIPDGIFSIVDLEGDISLFALELHLGKDSKRAINQILHHVELLITGGLSEKYDLAIGWKVVYVFDSEGITETVIGLFKQRVEEVFWQYFSFYSLGEIEMD